MIFEELLVLLLVVGLAGYICVRLFRRATNQLHQKMMMLREVEKALSQTDPKKIENLLILYGHLMNKELKGALEARKDDLTIGELK